MLGLKDAVLDYENQDDDALLGALRRLELMRLSLETLQVTGIGVAVNVLKKHRSSEIAGLARGLVGGWRALAKRSWKTKPAIADTPLDSVNPSVISEEAGGKTQPAIAETPPDSVNPSVISEETGEETDFFFSQLDQFPPLDEGALLATNSAQYEISKFFDGMDEDGNLRDNVETGKNERRSQIKDSNDARTHQVMCHGNEEHMRQEISANQPKPLNIVSRPPKPPGNSNRQTEPVATDLGPGRPSRLAIGHKSTDGKLDQVEPKWQTKLVGTNLGPGRPTKEAIEQRSSGKQDVAHNLKKPSTSLLDFDEASSEGALTDSGPGRPSKLAIEHKSSDGKQDQVGSNRQTKPVATNLGPGRPNLAIEQKRSGGKQDLARNLKKPSTTTLDSDEASVEALQARLPLAKKRLMEGYREADNAKKQRTIQRMELFEIPKQARTERRFNVKATNHIRTTSGRR